MRIRPFALGLGGNLGDVKSAFRQCVNDLYLHPKVTEAKVSSIYRTSPWGEVQGGDFLNAVLVGGWSGEDRELLELCRSLELEAGSPVSKDGSARFLDVDILFITGGVSSPALQLPHPRLAQRKFVLVPLSEVWCDQIPGTAFTPKELLLQVNDSSSIIFEGSLFKA